MIRKPAPVSSRQFHYDSARNELVADISSLNGYGRVYDDACDLGLTVVSHRTGRAMTFVVEHQEWTNEWELLWERLIPADRRDRASGITAVIFND